MRRRVLVLIAVALSLVCFAVPLRDLRAGFSVEGFLSSDEPVLREASRHYDEFEIPDNLLLFCYPEADPYSPAAFDRIEDLDRALRELPGVERVLTLASAPGLDLTFGDEMRQRLRASHTWRDLLVSRHDDAMGGIVVLDRRDSSPESRQDLFARLAALPEARGLDLKLAGIPFHRNTVIGLIRADQLFFIPLATAITAVLLWWFVPHLGMALLCLAVVPFTLVATLGTMAWCGVELTLLTSALPVLLMCMAVAGGVHLVGRFVEERRAGRDPGAAAVATLERLLLPCFLTALTTAIGFLSLTLASIPDLQQLGWFAALGVGYAFLFTVLVLPATLSLVRGLPGPGRADVPGALVQAAARAAGWRPAVVLLPAAVALVLMGWEALHVRQDNHLKGDLWEDSPAARSMQFYEDRFLAMAPSEVLVTSGVGFGDATARGELIELVTWLESLPAVDRTVSIADLMRDGAPMWLVRGMGGLGGLMTNDGTTARVLVFQADMGNNYLRRFRDAVAQQDRNLTALDVRVAGIQVVATTLVDRLTETLSRSFVGSLLLILTLVWWHFRSLRLGLIAIVPNLLPLVMNLAVMSLVDLELRPLTVISFCVAFGLAVDDTVHLLARYREERRHGRDPETALHTMLATAGRPVVVTTVLLLVGFLLILTSSFKGTVQFGALVSLALFGSMLGALFLMPALVRVTERAR